jgi:hypothetical protein
MRAKMRLGALGSAVSPHPRPLSHKGSRADRTCGRIRYSRRWDARFGPHPRPRSRTQERGDSGERLWPLIAVLGYCEQLFGPPLNPQGERGDSGVHVRHPIAVDGHREHLFCPSLEVATGAPMCGTHSGGMRRSRMNCRPHPLPRLRGTKGGCGGVWGTVRVPQRSA